MNLHYKKVMKHDNIYTYANVLRFVKHFEIGRHYQISNIPFFPLSSEITERVPELRQVGSKM